MSIESDVMTGVSSMIDFIKSQISLNLNEANNKKIIDVDRRTLEKISRVVELSIQTSFIKSSGEVLTAINNIKK